MSCERALVNERGTGKTSRTSAVSLYMTVRPDSFASTACAPRYGLTTHRVVCVRQRRLWPLNLLALFFPRIPCLLQTPPAWGPGTEDVFTSSGRPKSPQGPPGAPTCERHLCVINAATLWLPVPHPSGLTPVAGIRARSLVSSSTRHCGDMILHIAAARRGRGRSTLRHSRVSAGPYAPQRVQSGAQWLICGECE